MKAKLIIIIVLVFSFILGYSFVTKSNFFKLTTKKIANVQTHNYQQEILDTWVMENSPNDKIEFLANGQVKKYFDNQLQYTDTYSFSTTCDGLTNNNNDIFLKTIDGEDGSEYCDYINGVNANNSGILSLTTDSGRLVIYKRP